MLCKRFNVLLAQSPPTGYLVTLCAGWTPRSCCGHLCNCVYRCCWCAIRRMTLGACVSSTSPYAGFDEPTPIRLFVDKRTSKPPPPLSKLRKHRPMWTVCAGYCCGTQSVLWKNKLRQQNMFLLAQKPPAVSVKYHPICCS